MDTEVGYLAAALGYIPAESARPVLDAICTAHAQVPETDESDESESESGDADTVPASQFDRFQSVFRDHASDAGVLAESIEATVETLRLRGEMTVVDALADARVEALVTSYQTLLPIDSESDEAEAEQGDDSAWYAFLAENGPRWDGSEDSWQRFQQWFLYYAEQARVGTQARAFTDYVDGSPDKRAVFAQYGVTIVDAAQPEAASEDESRRAESPSEERVDDGHRDAALSELMVDHPELAELSPEELQQIVDETLRARTE
jgi:hypothetical protein